MTHRHIDSLDSLRSSADGSTTLVNTPTTRATLYSPEDFRLPLTSRVVNDHQPSLTPSRASRRAFADGLNGGADNFTPSAISYLNAGSTPDVNGVAQASSSPPGTSSSSSSSSALQPEGTPTLAIDESMNSPARLSRYVMVSNIPHVEFKSGWAERQIRQASSHRPCFANVLDIKAGTDGGKGAYYIRLDNIGLAQSFVNDVQVINSMYDITLIDMSRYFAQCLADPEARRMNTYEGHVHVTAYVSSTESADDLRAMRGAVKSWINKFGLWWSNEFIAAHPRSGEFRFELMSLRAANRLVVLGHDIVQDGNQTYSITVTQYSPESYAPTTHPLLLARSLRTDSLFSSRFAHLSLGGSRGGALPSGSSDIHSADPYSVRGSSAMLHQARRSRYSGQHNVVDVQKIVDGEDVRTTIMLRNIPNRLNADDLKWLLDQTSFGRYDFSYLRIDFKNHCNVGYAFVNFVKAEDIIAFLNYAAGRRWLKEGASEKVAEISYATIQGRDCLVEKFRNSSVMFEHPMFRPKLWYVDEDGSPELVGREMNFPPPNNPSKLQRSRDNAANVGLFPPRPIGEYDYRNRHSLFDRGTPRALLDDELGLGPREVGHISLALRPPREMPDLRLPRDMVNVKAPAPASRPHPGLVNECGNPVSYPSASAGLPSVSYAVRDGVLRMHAANTVLVNHDPHNF